MMDRRAFLSGSLGTLAAPRAVCGQPAAKPPTIGFLGPLTSSAQSQWTTAFEQRMRELGWVEGRTVVVEYRWAEGRSEQLLQIAAEFVALRVSVIVTGETAAVVAVKQATSAIPIVFATAGDPVGTGLVKSLAQPGGNITGLSVQSSELAGKRLELLREVVPGVRRLAITANVGSRIGVLELGEIQAAARTLGLACRGEEGNDVRADGAGCGRGRVDRRGDRGDSFRRRRGESSQDEGP